MSLYKTGLKRSPEPPKFRFGTYFQSALLPPIPATFGHQNAYSSRGWGMLLNDYLSDCTVAGAMHAIMLWRRVINDPVRFSDLDAQKDYFAITGGGDDGADMVTVADYWRKTGFRDMQANRHRILAYMQSDPKNLDHVDAACFLFEMNGLGVMIGDREMEAFQSGQPWDNPHWPSEDYHYIPMVGKDADYRYVITWGGVQPLTQAWYEAKVVEVVSVLSNENLLAGKSLEGFNIDELEGDLENVA